MITAADYHADNVGASVPTLSHSILRVLLNGSPAHAKAAHPKLTDQPVREEATHFDIGTAAHAMLLQGEDVCVQVDAPDWRSKAAREERDAIRELGKVPLLVHQWEAARAMVASALEQLSGRGVFANGEAEKTIVWTDEATGVSCRARLDWIENNGFAIDDYKTTSRSAAPEAWSKACFSIGADTQAAFYLRGVPDALFRFVVQETYAPYALCVYDMSPAVLDIANAKINYAIRLWDQCLRSGNWPAYPTSTVTVEPTPWAEGQWFEREERDAA